MMWLASTTATNKLTQEEDHSSGLVIEGRKFHLVPKAFLQVGVAEYDRPADVQQEPKEKSEIFIDPEAVVEYLECSVDQNFRPMLQPRQSPLEVEIEGNTSEQPSDFKFRKIAQPINISFKGLSLYLKSNQQKILSNVSGSMEHSRITAVMGPSGAGISLVIF